MTIFGERQVSNHVFSLVIGLQRASEGLQVQVGQGNVHFSVQLPHQESDFRLHQANPKEANKTDVSKRKLLQLVEIKYSNCFLPQENHRHSFHCTDCEAH